MREHAAEGSAPEATEEAVGVAPPAALPVTAPLTVQGLLGIQRRAGNRAAAALVARAPVAAPSALAFGATGSAVTSLQMHLNMVDEVKTELVVDGIFGPITQAAVREFQKAHPPLKATGVVDSDTEAEIAEAQAEDQDSEAIARKLFNLGAKVYERGQYGHAYAFFTRAGELEPRPNLLFSRAQALNRLGAHRDEAIALYESYLATENPVRKADAEAALKDLRGPEKTGDAKTDEAAARAEFGKGAALYEAKDYAHAYDEFTKAGELADRPNLLFSRAQALRRLGAHREQAIALYEAYLATDNPARKADAEAALAELKAPGKTGDAQKDEAAARGLFGKGAALYEAGDYAHAYDEFSRASEVDDRPNLLFSRAQALRKLGGHEDEAKALYQKYIDVAGSNGTRIDDAKQMLELLRTHGAGPR